MFEKVNPAHPDKIADRIAGAIVDLAYTKAKKPKIAVEVLLGHDTCNIIIETSEKFIEPEIQQIVNRIVGYPVKLNLLIAQQDPILAKNQSDKPRCGDNGIFLGCVVTEEEQKLTNFAYDTYLHFKSDGKYVLDLTDSIYIVCQSGTEKEDSFLVDTCNEYFTDYYGKINPLGAWTGGINVDSGATNRKLGSDMGKAVSGGGLHGKDLSKADVTINICCFLLAQERNCNVEAKCAIGDKIVTFILHGNRETILYMPYNNAIKKAKEYIDYIGGFERFAEWGLTRPNKN